MIADGVVADATRRIGPVEAERMARALTISLGRDPNEEVPVAEGEQHDGAHDECPFTGRPQPWRYAWRFRVRHVLAMFAASPATPADATAVRAGIDRAMAAHREVLHATLTSSTMTHREMAETAMSAALSAATPRGDDLRPGLIRALAMVEGSADGDPETRTRIADGLRQELFDLGTLVSPRE